MSETRRTLRPYQRHGAAFCAARPAALLADPPGLGKTPQSVRWMDLIEAQRVIICTTASYVYGFADEVRSWQEQDRTVAVDDPDADVCVTTAGRVARDWQRYASRRYDGLIVDECHHLKDPQAQRTRAIYGDDLKEGQGLVGAVEARGGRVLIMSGTPTPNYQTELYTHYARLWPDLLHWSILNRRMTRDDFVRRYSIAIREPKSGELRPTVNRNVPELREKNAKIALRREWREVGIDMPAVQVKRTPLFASLEDALRARPDLAGELKQALEDLSRYAFAGREDALADDDRAAALLAELATDMQVHLATARRLLGQVKAPLAAKAVLDFLTNNPHERCVVFAFHRDTMAILEQHLSQIAPGVVIAGGTNSQARAEAANRFQHSSKYRWFLGQLQAASEALTLTAASTVFFAESAWTPTVDEQAIARCRRYGQTRTVLAEYLTVPGTLDDVLARVVARKSAGIGQLWSPSDP